MREERPPEGPWAGWPIVVTISVATVAAAAVLALSPTDSEANAKIIAAVVTLMGVVMTGMISYLGHRYVADAANRDRELKRQADERAADQHELEAERLKLEAAVRSLALLSTPAGTDSPPGQRAGALFALASYGHVDFALGLLDSIWDENFPFDSGLWIIDKALTSDIESNHLFAAALMEKKAHKLATPDGSLSLPKCLLFSWNMEWSTLTRFTIIRALGKAALIDSERLIYIAGNFIAIFYFIFITEINENNKTYANKHLSLLLELFNDITSLEIYLPHLDNNKKGEVYIGKVEYKTIHSIKNESAKHSIWSGDSSHLDELEKLIDTTIKTHGLI